jgi:hypothetical protein
MSHVTLNRPSIEDPENPNKGWTLKCDRCGEVEPMDPVADDRKKVDETIEAFVDLHRDRQ